MRDPRFAMTVAQLLRRAADVMASPAPPKRQDLPRAAKVLREELDLSERAFPDSYLLYAMTEAMPHFLGPPRHYLWELSHPSQKGVWIPMSTPTLPKFQSPGEGMRNVIALYPIKRNE